MIYSLFQSTTPIPILVGYWPLHLGPAHRFLTDLQIEQHYGILYMRQPGGRLGLLDYRDSDFDLSAKRGRSDSGKTILSSCLAVAWSSVRQSSVVSLSTGAQLTAASTVIRDIRKIKLISHEVGVPFNNFFTLALDVSRIHLITLCVDSNEAVDLQLELNLPRLRETCLCVHSSGTS